MKNCLPFAFAVLIFLFSLASACAEEPTALYIFPPGGQRGTTVEFKVGGCYFHGEAHFEMLGAGVEASDAVKETETFWLEGPIIGFPTSSRPEDYPRDHAGQMKIAADAEIGPRYWRTWTSQGATGVLPFVVGDLPEVVEAEVAGEPIPQDVSLPVTINGRIFPREDVDIWIVTAKAGQVITCEVLAARLGSPLDARLEVRDPAGRIIAEAIDGLGADPRLRFTAETDGVHEVRIHDVNFGGLQPFVYRLTITSGAYVDAIYPLGGQRGTEVGFALRGQAVPGDPVKLRLPGGGPDEFKHGFVVGGQLTNPVRIRLGDLPESLESEPNGEPGQAIAVSAPTVVNGRIDPPGDADCWTFDAKKDDQLLLEIEAARLGTPLDSVLTVEDAEGKVIVTNDDLAAGITDSRLLFKAPADGRYTARVEERFKSRGGAEFAYRLRIAPPSSTPDFELKLTTDERRKVWSDFVTVFREADEEPAEGDQKKQKPAKPNELTQPILSVAVERHGGFEGEIELAVENLPEGVSVSGTTIPAKKNDAQLIFTAAPTAKIGVARIHVVGKAEIDGQQMIRRVVVPVMGGDDLLDHTLLAVAMPAPFRVDGEYKFAFAPQGSVHSRTFRLDRGGFTGPITVRLADRQGRHLQGVTGPTITVPPGAEEFEYPVRMAPWMELGRTSRSNVMLSGTVADHDGSEHVVSFCDNGQDQQVIAIISPGELAVEAERTSLLIEPGGTADLLVRVKRSPPISGADVRVELVVPPHIHGISADPVTLSAGQSEATMTLVVAEALGNVNMPVLLRATTLEGERPHVAETELQLVPPR